jgi:hypothetical protein
MNNYWLADFLIDLEEQDKKALAPAEQEYANAMMAIVAKYGKLSDGDENGIWVGYVQKEDNDNFEIGVMCSNCYFYDGGSICKIVKQSIEPGGYCRLAAIPPGLVKSSGDMDDDNGDGED